MNKIKVGIVGATGYAGVELVRILINHPKVELVALSSVSFEGQSISEVYPNLTGIIEDVLCDEDSLVKKSEVVFASLPHGLSEPIAKKCADGNKLFIDLGADFRLHDEKEYKEWYNFDYNEKDLHKKAVYCIPELHKNVLADSKIIGNPGCYPTAVGLGLAPILKSGIADSKGIIIDAKSGVTGAGRALSQGTHYPDCNEVFAPYKVAEHRHTPEIEQTLSELTGEQVKVTFVPHLLPVNRGILATMYLSLTEKKSADEIHKSYTSFYEDKTFVRVKNLGETASTKNIKFSNFCDISLHLDQRTNRLIVVSAIDNMVKGAAGQAVQNMNLCCGFSEDMGLNLIPPAF